MTRTLAFRNRQRTRLVDGRLLRRLTLAVLRDELRIESWELAIHLVDAREMARVNWDFLQHKGSTDVITFDHSEAPPAPGALHGEIFICLDDAVKQARQFGTRWQEELARYVIHGLLHLCGHDDLSPVPRRAMKREENRLLRAMSREFPLQRLARRKSAPRSPLRATRSRQ